MTTSAADAINSPAWQDPEFARLDPMRTRCTHVMEGLDKLRDESVTYLPKLPRESPANYKIRKGIAELTNLLAAAVRSAEGLMIVEPPTLLDEASDALKSVWADIDGMQTGGEVWLRGVLRGMLVEGFCVAVVSTPVKAGQQVSLAEARRKRLRPYVSLYKACDVLSPRFTRDGGRMVLARIVLRERVKESVGKFGSKQVTQYRVLTRSASGPHTSIVLRENAEGEWVQEGGVDKIETDELPVVEFSSLPTAGFAQAPPQLLELADMTLAHWNIKTDRRWSMKQACFPWLVRVGYIGDETTTASVNEALDLPPGGDAKWISPDGTAFQPTRDDLTDIERRASSIVFAFITGQSAAVQKSATEASIDQKGQDAGMAGLAISLRDGLNKLGAIISEMLGEEVRDTYFQVQTAFRSLVRDPVYLRLLFEVWKEHGIDISAFVYALKFGKLPEDDSVENLVVDALVEAEAAAAKAAELAKEQQGGSGKPAPTDKSPVDDSQRQAA